MKDMRIGFVFMAIGIVCLFIANINSSIERWRLEKENQYLKGVIEANRDFTQKGVRNE